MIASHCWRVWATPKIFSISTSFAIHSFRTSTCFNNRLDVGFAKSNGTTSSSFCSSKVLWNLVFGVCHQCRGLPLSLETTRTKWKPFITKGWFWWFLGSNFSCSQGDHGGPGRSSPKTWNLGQEDVISIKIWFERKYCQKRWKENEVSKTLDVQEY